MSFGEYWHTPIPTFERPGAMWTTQGPLVGVLRQFYIGQLGVASAVLYTAPAPFTVASQVGIEPKARVEEIWLCNTDSSARTVTLYVVENGGSAADNRAILKGYSLAANSKEVIRARFVIEAGGTLRGLADVADKVTVLVSGTEYA